MSASIIIPPDWPLHGLFDTMSRRQRVVFLAGLPGVGKSLFVQQLALMAHRAGRVIHLLQWDVTRAAFETEGILARYPEVNGFTHIAIKKAVGLWARGAVLAWHERHPGPEHMLIGEVALVGNRLIELAQTQADEAEAFLSGPETLFVLPVPSREIRRLIESARERTIVEPQHARETADAPPNVLRGLWEDAYREGHEAGVVTAAPPVGPIPYDPDIYRAVFQHWLRDRRLETIDIDTRLPAAGSVYDLDVIAGELAATPGEVEATMARVEGLMQRPGWTPSQHGQR